MARPQQPTPPPPGRSVISMQNLPLHQPGEWVPDTFPSAQTVLSRMVPYIQGDANLPPGFNYAGTYAGHDIQLIDPQDTRVAGHEAGHAIYHLDLTPEQKAAWRKIHDWHLKTFTAPDQASPASYFPDDPGHSFARAYGDFVANPSMFQARFPKMYNFIKEAAGFEYSRGRGYNPKQDPWYQQYQKNKSPGSPVPPPVSAK